MSPAQWTPTDKSLFPVKLIVMLASLSPAMATDGPNGCIHGNKTYEVGQVFYDGCAYKCVCRDGGLRECDTRCPVFIDAIGYENCEWQESPEDPCCTIPVCFNQTTTKSSTQAPVLITETKSLTISTARENSTQSTIEVPEPFCSNKTHDVGKVFYDGCAYKCICREGGMRDCESRCPVYNETKGYEDCEWQEAADDACCTVPVCPNRTSTPATAAIDAWPKSSPTAHDTIPQPTIEPVEPFCVTAANDVYTVGQSWTEGSACLPKSCTCLLRPNGSTESECKGGCAAIPDDAFRPTIECPKPELITPDDACLCPHVVCNYPRNTIIPTPLLPNRPAIPGLEHSLPAIEGVVRQPAVASSHTSTLPPVREMRIPDVSVTCLHKGIRRQVNEEWDETPAASPNTLAIVMQKRCQCKLLTDEQSDSGHRIGTVQCSAGQCPQITDRHLRPSPECPVPVVVKPEDPTIMCPYVICNHSEETANYLEHVSVIAINGTSVRVRFTLPQILVGLIGHAELHFTTNPLIPSYEWSVQKFARPNRLFDTPNIEYHLMNLKPDTTYYFQIRVIVEALQSGPESEVYKLKMPAAGPSRAGAGTTRTTTHTSPVLVSPEDVRGCLFKGKLVPFGEEVYDGCKAVCHCGSDAKMNCGIIDCPHHFDPHVSDCLEWEIDPDFESEPPHCCPKAKCKSTGSCLFAGLSIPNYQSVPAESLPCGTKCLCLNGNITCKNRCPPLPDVPPVSLPCPHSMAFKGHPSGETCCVQWLCRSVEKTDSAESKLVSDRVNCSHSVSETGASNRSSPVATHHHSLKSDELRPYYIALTIMALFAAVTSIAFLSLLCVILRSKSSAKAPITRSLSDQAYDNPTYKACDNDRSGSNDHNHHHNNLNHRNHDPRHIPQQIKLNGMNGTTIIGTAQV